MSTLVRTASAAQTAEIEMLKQTNSRLTQQVSELNRQVRQLKESNDALMKRLNRKTGGGLKSQGTSATGSRLSVGSKGSRADLSSVGLWDHQALPRYMWPTEAFRCGTSDRTGSLQAADNNRAFSHSHISADMWV